MKFKSYIKYKDSGIDWIGQIPEEWQVRKLKYNYDIVGKTNISASEGNEEGKFPFFTSGESIKYIDKPAINGEYIIVGDGGIPNFKYYKGEFSYSDHCFLLKTNKEFFSKFLYYFLIGNVEIFDILCFHGMGLRNLDQYKFNSFFSNLPSFPEQIAIANFLDKKTAEIEELIEKDKKLIGLLKEKRAALINHAVTKGLDPNANMKDSGIDWIGEIPEGWEVKKLKFSVYEKKIKDTTKNPNTKFIGLEHIESEAGKLISSSTLEDIDGESVRFKENNVLFGKLRPYLAKVIKVDFRGSCTGELIVYEARGKIDSKFLFYRLLSKGFIDLVNSTTYGVKMPRADPTQLSNIKIAWPPLPEQTIIVNFLGKATVKMDKTIQKIEQKIKFLEEYKKSLIHHTVTGKIDVREVKI